MPMLHLRLMLPPCMKTVNTPHEMIILKACFSASFTETKSLPAVALYADVISCILNADWGRAGGDLPCGLTVTETLCTCCTGTHCDHKCPDPFPVSL